ncbi:contact-dependent growth inhibition system immunity protein [Cupriavidus campinensis]|uniref:contact-dependent growth inhibition system immunity protein n=1 Tax=Cupriavidus campinensis TaxID=151783 RepID=UPI0011EE5895|nr:contact-dependent growth inhibition system immunity protein [Cupriavidus campinensis]
MATPKYPQLWHLIIGYFNEDADMWGENIEEIVETYMRQSDPDMRKSVMREIEDIKADHPFDLDAAFENLFGGEPDPALWGCTTQSFLNEIARVLRQ